MQLRFLLFNLLLLLLSASVTGKGKTIRLVVTSDIHARLFPYDYLNNNQHDASLAQVYSFVQKLRADEKNNVVLLDNGDLLQGTPAGYFANFRQDEERNLFSRILNFMGYDAATVGNHDIEAGPLVYNRLKKEFSFPYLGANVIDAESGKPYFVPYTIVTREGVKIAVLGLTTTGVPNWLPYHLWEGLEFRKMLDAAYYWVSFIEENESPDLIIGLFHSGMGPEEFDFSGKEPDNFSLYIARNVPGFDVVFTGHDHRVGVQHIINNQGEEVLIAGPGAHADNVAVVTINLEEKANMLLPAKRPEGEIVSVSDLTPHKEFMKEFSGDMDQVTSYTNKEVGVLENDLNSFDSFFGSAPFTDIIHQVQLEITSSDISFTAPLAFNQTLEKGMLYAGDFFKLYHYENYLYAMNLKGFEIRDYLEFSYSLWLDTMENEDGHLLLFRYDKQGQAVKNNSGAYMLRHPYFNFDSAAGIRYTVDVSERAGNRVKIISMEDGSSFDEDKTYRVAINSYRGSGGGGHLTEGAGIANDKLSERIVYTSEKDLRSELINFFSKKKSLEVSARNNWQIIPAEWVKKAKVKDTRVIFPQNQE